MQQIRGQQLRPRPAIAEVTHACVLRPFFAMKLATFASVFVGAIPIHVGTLLTDEQQNLLRRSVGRPNGEFKQQWRSYVRQESAKRV